MSGAEVKKSNEKRLKLLWTANFVILVIIAIVETSKATPVLMSWSKAIESLFAWSSVTLPPAIKSLISTLRTTGLWVGVLGVFHESLTVHLSRKYARIGGATAYLPVFMGILAYPFASTIAAGYTLLIHPQKWSLKLEETPISVNWNKFNAFMALLLVIPPSVIALRGLPPGSYVVWVPAVIALLTLVALLILVYTPPTEFVFYYSNVNELVVGPILGIITLALFDYPSYHVASPWGRAMIAALVMGAIAVLGGVSRGYLLSDEIKNHARTHGAKVLASLPVISVDMTFCIDKYSLEWAFNKELKVEGCYVEKKRGEFRNILLFETYDTRNYCVSLDGLTKPVERCEALSDGRIRIITEAEVMIIDPNKKQASVQVLSQESFKENNSLV